MRSKVKTAVKRMTAIMIALIMCANLGMTIAQSTDPVTVYAESTSNEVSVTRMTDSVNKVISSVDELKTIMTPQEQSTIKTIFQGFVSAAGTIGTVTGAINSSVTFLKLIGIMEDGNAQAMANISRQLTAINEKMAEMDGKLDDISTKMEKAQATSDFNNRGLTANQMNAAWSSFSTNYMEKQLDESIRKYNSMLMDGMKDWLEYRTPQARNADDRDLLTNRVIVQYKLKNAAWRYSEPFHNNFDQEQCLKNYLKPDVSKADTARPDPYTIYQEDLLEKRTYLVLDNSFFPPANEMRWDVNTYHSELEDYIFGKLKEWKNNPTANEHIQWYGSLNMKQAEEEDLKAIAGDVVNAIIYREASYKVNESADFSTTVVKQFGEYCEHLGLAKQGIDAMMKTILLTNAFEFQAGEDIKTFCNQMMLKTGVYGTFVMDVMGVSEYITDAEKEKAAGQMCDAIDMIKRTLDRSITGFDNYCYVTNSLIYYGEVSFSGSIQVDYSKRGSYASYYKYHNDSIQTNYDGDTMVKYDPSFVGDTNALLLSYYIRQSGGSMDHNYLVDHFAKGWFMPVKRSDIVSSLNGKKQMPTDSLCQLKVHNAVGNYFKEGSTLMLNSLPSGATSDHLVYRQMMQGSTFNGSDSSLYVNRPLFGMAVYGESHFYWTKDEAAVMGGPFNNASFTESVKDVKTGSSFFSDQYYTKTYKCSVAYNALLSQEYSKTSNSPQNPDPLGDLDGLNLSMRKAAFKDYVDKIEAKVNAGKWTNDSLQKVKDAIANARKYINWDMAESEDLDIAKRELDSAFSNLKPQPVVKKKIKQNLKVQKKNRIIKRKALKKSPKIIKLMTVKNAKGKVTFKLVKVSKKKFKKFFKVNSKTGKIKIRKGLKKGKYRLTIRVKAAGNSKYLPMTKTVIINIKVK